MLLSRLYEYSERIADLAPPMYTKTPIRWYVDLDAMGRFQGVAGVLGEGKRADRGRLLDVPALPVKRTMAVIPILLADNAQYVLGLVPEGKDPDRIGQYHAAFKELVHRCADATEEPGVHAVARFLDGYRPGSGDIPDDVAPAANVTFRVAGELPVHNPAVQSWWADYQAAGLDGPRGQCLITGRRCRVVKRLPQPIKGIPGGQSSGLPLISANSDAFESYGRKASLNAPVSFDAAERIGKALNYLIRGEDTHLSIGPLMYVAWTREPVEFSWFNLIGKPDAEQVRELLKSPWKGRELSIVDSTGFYAAALSASGGRAVIRDWVETTVEHVKANLARWFRLMELTDIHGGEGRPYGIYPLAACLYHDANRDMVANVPRALLRCALNGGQLPGWLLGQAIKRNRAEQGITRPRAVLTKMVLISQINNPQEGYMTELESANRDPAYLCGRLLAVLEAIQRVAVPGAQATILDRYYGTASSAPATVFGTLLRGAQAHLAKLRKTRKPAYLAITRRLEEITEHLPEFPRTLTLKQQALFSLGYYHQRAADRSQARRNKELRDTAPDAEPILEEE